MGVNVNLARSLNLVSLILFSLVILVQTRAPAEDVRAIDAAVSEQGGVQVTHEALVVVPPVQQVAEWDTGKRHHHTGRAGRRECQMIHATQSLQSARVAVVEVVRVPDLIHHRDPRRRVQQFCHHG